MTAAPAAEVSSPFFTILHPEDRSSAELEVRDAPAFFRDLNLDQIVAAITREWQEYDLGPLFQAQLHSLDAVAYRQEVMQDLERRAAMDAVRECSEAMRTMRSYLKRSEKSGVKEEKERWFLNAAVVYVDGIERLRQALQPLDVLSRGLRAFRRFVASYVEGSRFSTLATEAKKLTADLSAIRYSVLLRGRGVTVQPFHDEPDYSVEVERTFDKFRRNEVRDYRIRFPEDGGLNHVEAQVLQRVARLNPEVFGALEAFCRDRAGFVDATIGRFDREIQFYVAYVSYVDGLRRADLPFSYPRLSQSSKDIWVENAFDLALARTLSEQQARIVQNGFFLRDDQRIFVVSGPNQGGKTTFARMFGQLHYLASLGCAVPGTNARLFLCDGIFTHFERQDSIETLRGKLQDDLVRIRQVLQQATPASLVIMNEMFSSTTLHDALFLSRHIMARLSSLDVLGVWVTFLADLASFDRKTVSMVSAIDPRDPAIRTYTIERRSADGLAYALALAEKHHVTDRWLRERIPA